jgi:putative transposase
MPRPLRKSAGGLIYHVLNRANARRQIFVTDGDYIAFERTLQEAHKRAAGAIQLFAYIVMPNHFHMVLRPAGDTDLSEFMRWLTVTHTQRWHAFHETSGTGHLYQGRFKSFPVESDDRHFLCVCRYVERNALRAGLVTAAQHWRWCSLWRRLHQANNVLLTAWPVPEPPDWLSLVNAPQTIAEEQALRCSVVRGRPYGSEQFQHWTADVLGLGQTLRAPGRPSKTPSDVTT